MFLLLIVVHDTVLSPVCTVCAKLEAPAFPRSGKIDRSVIWILTGVGAIWTIYSLYVVPYLTTSVFIHFILCSVVVCSCVGFLASRYPKWLGTHPCGQVKSDSGLRKMYLSTHFLLYPLQTPFIPTCLICYILLVPTFESIIFLHSKNSPVTLFLPVPKPYSNFSD